jgi:hypothetical protein
METKIGWFSCGITSAVACYLSPDAVLKYIGISTSHPDNQRFLNEFQQFDGRKIEILTPKYKNQFEVIEKERYFNGPTGAKCTSKLKIETREKNCLPGDIHIFGFTTDEIERAKLFKLRNPEVKISTPLIDYNLSKKDCIYIFESFDIQMPRMYELGYKNNNCIGCVKGGKGYWKKIRIDFPAYFQKMAALERSIKATCIKGFYLDQLDKQPELFEAPECSLFCGGY